MGRGGEVGTCRPPNQAKGYILTSSVQWKIAFQHSRDTFSWDLSLWGGARWTLQELDNARPLAQCKIKAPGYWGGGVRQETHCRPDLISTLPSALFTGTTYLHHGITRPHILPSLPLSGSQWLLPGSSGKRRFFLNAGVAGDQVRMLPQYQQLPVLRRRVDISRRHNGLWVIPIVFLGVGGVVWFAATKFHAWDDGPLEFASGVSVGAFATRYDPNEGPAHLLVGQSVNDGVGTWVQHSQNQEIFCFV